jgi:hypothetical protein
MRQVITLSIILIVILTTTSFLVSYSTISNTEKTQPIYLGVSFCGNTTTEAKLLIDRVENYTNLFVLQSGPVSKNETAINEICDYATAAGLNIIVYFGWFDPDYPWQKPWLDTAKQRWRDQFLGVYYYDEPGGIQLDYNWERLFNRIRDWNVTLYQTYAPAIEGNTSMSQYYDLSAKMFTDAIKADSGIQELKNRSISVYTSDYALYWFDYLGGYDVVFTQFGRNASLVQDIAFARGASRMLDKPWGAIITWTYDEPPYIVDGEEMYSQMIAAYVASADYIVIFNYPQIEGNDYGILTDEHFEAIEKFWNDITEKSAAQNGLDATRDSSKAEAALVLPRSYGWGMRRPDDRLWYWGPDEKSAQVWEISRKLLSQYGLSLDIVYDDPAFPVAAKYPQVYYWNQST